MTGPCSWPVLYADCVEGGLPPALADLTVEARERVESMAVEFLWNWTDRGYGVCDVVVRPCKTAPRGSTFWGGARPAGFQITTGMAVGSTVIEGPEGEYNVIPALFPVWSGCSCEDQCGCGLSASVVRLPGPVVSVTEVQIDGEVVDPGTYRVDNRTLLVRTDGNPWPTTQNMDAELGSENTWAVSYQFGVEVPIGGQVAAGVLAAEMALALCNDGACKLPERVQTVTRQGVTVAMLDNMEGIDKGRTGVWLVDSWVQSVMAPRGRSAVYSPDIPRPRHRVSTWT